MSIAELSKLEEKKKLDAVKVSKTSGVVEQNVEHLPMHIMKQK